MSVVYFLEVISLISCVFGIRSFDSQDITCSHSTPVNDYGFIAMLFNSRLPNVTCVGAIITNRWILDNCVDEPGFIYEYIKLAPSPSSNNANVYIIIDRILFKNYKRLELTLSDFDTHNLFAAKHAISLHKTDRIIQETYFSLIKLSSTKNVPTCAQAVFLHNSAMQVRQLKITTNNYCNGAFQPYFYNRRQTLLGSRQLCVYPEGITPEECCGSQPLLLSEGQLIGIMAWSSACSAFFSVDPWVFTHVFFYREWILNVTQESTL